MVELQPSISPVRSSNNSPVASQLPWRDVTQEILSCVDSANLCPGQVITTDNSGNSASIKLEDGMQISNSLTNAMSAMEMMEPKMDASCTFKEHFDSKELVQNFDDALRLKLASESTSETDEEIVTLFDVLANYFSRFLEGDFYPNSIGSCVYNLINISEPLSKNLDSICLSICTLFKINAKMATDIINFAGIHEEEDFASFEIFKQGQPIDSDFYCDKIERLLKEKYVDTSSPVNQRLQLLLTFTEMMQYLHHILQGQNNKLDKIFARATANYCQLLKNRATTILETLEESESTRATLKTVTLKNRKDLIFGFDPFMSYPDMAGGFPRPSIYKNRSYFYSWLNQLLDDLTNSIIICQTSKLSSITEMGWSFSRKASSLFPRSVTALILSIKLITNPEDQPIGLNHIDQVKDSANNSNLTPIYKEIDEEENKSTKNLVKLCLDELYLLTNKAVIFSDRKFGTQKFNAFFSDFCKYIDRFLPSICEVSSRQHSTFIFTIERFNSLLYSAREVDKEFFEMSKQRKNKKIVKNGISCLLLPKDSETMLEDCVKYYLYDMSIKHLLLGFELELYTEREFCMVYFVLDHFLELYLKVLTVILKWFRFENNKLKTLDDELRQTCLTLESKLSRAKILQNYTKGMLLSLIHMNIGTSQYSKKFKSKFYNEKKIFKKRFETLFANTELSNENMYANYLSEIANFQESVQDKMLLALEYFNRADAFCINISNIEGFTWCTGPLCRQKSVDLPDRNEFDRLQNLIKMNCISCKLEKVLKGKKKLTVEVDKLGSLPVLKLV